MYTTCDIFTTDQWSQYKSNIFIECLINNKINISIGGRGRWADNIFIERLWKTIKYKCIYNEFNTVKESNQILKE